MASDFDVHRASTTRRERLPRCLETESLPGLTGLQFDVHPASTARSSASASRSLDPGCSLDGFPVAAVEVAEVEVAAPCVREDQQAVSSRPEFVERLDRDRLQRNRASAQPRLGVLDPSVRIRPSDLDDAGRAIHVAVFEREQLGRSKPGRGRSSGPG
jgi:hypothetical protein